jgi:hypothetical protein
MIESSNLKMNYYEFVFMGTQRPKVQGYILPELYAQYEAWKRRQGITKDSLALNEILREFLALEEEQITHERFEALEGK